MELNHYLGVIMEAIPFCTIIADRKDPSRSGSGSAQPGTWELYNRVKGFRVDEIGTDKYTYMNEDNDKC